jgi:predicted nucleic acid-binding protein
MITAVDTNVLLDLFLDSPEHAERAERALRAALARGSLIICEIVYAELVPQFGDDRLLAEAVESLGIRMVPILTAAASAAGRAWAAYRRSGGARPRILADFLIGAHALTEADCLLTRDRGFYRAHFTGLTVVSPSDPTGELNASS